MLHCNADTPEEMHHWITLLQRSKGDARVDGQEFIIRGTIQDGDKQHRLLLEQNLFIKVLRNLEIQSGFIQLIDFLLSFVACIFKVYLCYIQKVSKAESSHRP